MQSNDSNQDEIIDNDDVGADIAATIEKLKAEPEPVVDPLPVAEPTDEPAEPIAPVRKYDAPQGYTAKVKEKWDTLPEDVQAELVKREEDFHKMVTSRDGELNLGREMKEVITPYLPIIQAEGGTPAKAVGDLLNTAYVLRTGTPEQKSAIIRTVCQQYGVDINSAVGEQEYIDPTIQSLQQEIANLKKMANPEQLISRLQQEQEKSTIQKEADAFARDPANKYFDKVKPFMTAFLGEGIAKDYKEAYDMACNAHPEIRSILDAERKAAEQEKRKTELKAKQNAASSVVGSPATIVSNAESPTDDIESSVRAAFRAANGQI
jgi:hypothetical protein